MRTLRARVQLTLVAIRERATEEGEGGGRDRAPAQTEGVLRGRERNEECTCSLAPEAAAALAEAAAAADRTYRSLPYPLYPHGPARAHVRRTRRHQHGKRHQQTDSTKIRCPLAPCSAHLPPEAAPCPTCTYSASRNCTPFVRAQTNSGCH